MKKILMSICLLTFSMFANSATNCASDNLTSNVRNISIFSALSLSYLNEDIYAIFFQGGDSSEHPHKLVIFSKNCLVLYEQYYDDHPISIIPLSDVADFLAVISMSANSYVVDVIHFKNTREISVIFNSHSRVMPSFIFDGKTIAPDIKICKHKCQIYHFNGARYIR